MLEYRNHGKRGRLSSLYRHNGSCEISCDNDGASRLETNSISSIHTSACVIRAVSKTLSTDNHHMIWEL